LDIGAQLVADQAEMLWHSTAPFNADAWIYRCKCIESSRLMHVHEFATFRG
jgi:hypothetical protein